MRASTTIQATIGVLVQFSFMRQTVYYGADANSGGSLGDDDYDQVHDPRVRNTLHQVDWHQIDVKSQSLFFGLILRIVRTFGLLTNPFTFCFCECELASPLYVADGYCVSSFGCSERVRWQLKRSAGVYQDENVLDEVKGESDKVNLGRGGW